ncbi:MoxR family ATPase [Danxiaibacter flavus]|uniref:MoxR family ATPase n=1 Tax=Danxiaibacter flavus TaxID=3049108 RepID=A0ABV3ZDZ1_9BACT|nr:MoxR family ATPase [Chitinophagaceae bacterium DXS]
MEETIFQERIDLSRLNEAVMAIMGEIKKVIVGQDEMLKLIIAAILADGHVLIEGAPGVAKTLTARLVAKSMAVDFSRIQFTPDLMPSDVLGTSIFSPKNGEFEFKKGPIFSNIVLIDEINRAPAKTQAALFEVMEERQVTIDGQSYLMESPFMIVATQNPIEYEGTYRLPEAQLDRFLFKINVPYPTEAQEMNILANFHNAGNQNILDSVIPVLSAEQVQIVRTLTKQVLIDEKLLQFIAKITITTRSHKSLFLGASPRASLALMNASKAIAALNGRDFVIPDDVVFVAPSVLRHRLLLAPEKEMEGITTDEVIQQIIHSIEIPR